MKKNQRIHVIDDEPIIHEVLGELLSSEGYDVVSSQSGEEALEKHETNIYDLVLLDLLMPGMNGLDVLKQLKIRDSKCVVIIITAFASVDSAIKAMKIGAYDYIQKPFKHDELLLVIKRGIERKSLKDENIRLKDALDEKFGFEKIIGKSTEMDQVYELVKSSAPTRSTILIEGESGTGKELIAHAIHQKSDRKQFPFIIVNSGSLPPDLLESQMFGHVKGAFTGAISNKKGLFEAAHNGTIFFDEISCLSRETQVKLLRVIQDREFMQLGGTKTIKVNVRIIAATNIKLEEMIIRNEFREDLYYRLNVIKIEIPPLRNRKEDIPLLINHFIQTYNKETGKDVQEISEKAIQILINYNWPGNVRELENLIERAIVLSNSPVINPENLPSFLTGKYMPFELEHDSFNNLNLKELTTNFQKKAILHALKKSNGIQKKAAQLLGIKATTLNEMIKRIKINPNDIFN